MSQARPGHWVLDFGRPPARFYEDEGVDGWRGRSRYALEPQNSPLDFGSSAAHRPSGPSRRGHLKPGYLRRTNKDVRYSHARSPRMARRTWMPACAGSHSEGPGPPWRTPSEVDAAGGGTRLTSRRANPLWRRETSGSFFADVISTGGARQPLCAAIIAEAARVVPSGWRTSRCSFSGPPLEEKGPASSRRRVHL